MKMIHQQDNKYVLRFDPGDELIEELKEFCHQEKIDAGFFVGLGAAKHLKLAWYNIETKTYEEKEFNEFLEIANLTGNIALLDWKIIIHVHGTFSKRDLSTIAGHVSKLVVGGACEIKLERFDTIFKRELDPSTGLNLLQ